MLAGDPASGPAAPEPGPSGSREGEAISTSVLQTGRPRVKTEKCSTVKVLHAGLCDPGRRRPAHQDRCFADTVLGLYLVADGMGDAAAGRTAAQLVVDILPFLLRKQLRGIRDLADPRAWSGRVRWSN